MATQSFIHKFSVSTVLAAIFLAVVTHDTYRVMKLSSIIALMMEAASTSETSVSFYLTARCNILKDSYLRNLCSLKKRTKFDTHTKQK
jgi:alpha-D-ribose 1-methylphosphonate 5-triphosphate diphosphatase PhnM